MCKYDYFKNPRTPFLMSSILHASIIKCVPLEPNALHFLVKKRSFKLGEELATRFTALTVTQKKLGDFFSEMSLKSKDLQEEFTYNADTQKALSKNGETLSFCLTAFNNALHTLIFKTMEDTVMFRIANFNWSCKKFNSSRYLIPHVI